MKDYGWLCYTVFLLEFLHYVSDIALFHLFNNPHFSNSSSFCNHNSPFKLVSSPLPPSFSMAGILVAPVLQETEPRGTDGGTSVSNKVSGAAGRFRAPRGVMNTGEQSQNSSSMEPSQTINSSKPREPKTRGEGK